MVASDILDQPKQLLLHYHCSNLPLFNKRFQQPYRPLNFGRMEIKQTDLMILTKKIVEIPIAVLSELKYVSSGTIIGYINILIKILLIIYL